MRGGKSVNERGAAQKLPEPSERLRNRTFRFGRFGPSRFCHGAFRSDYNILQESYMLTFQCKRT